MATTARHHRPWQPRTVGFVVSAVLLLGLVPWRPLDGRADAAAQDVQLRAAPGHVMKYYVSLPHGWSRNRRWPVVIVIPGAARNFEATAREFARARGPRPFIIAVPVVLSTGPPAHLHRQAFPYQSSDWARAALEGECWFDEAGMRTVMNDLKKQLAAEPKFLLVASREGGDLAWTTLFRHPERWRAAVLVAPDYRGDCMKERWFSKNRSRESLPIVLLRGSGRAPGTGLEVASAHGFRRITESRLAQGARPAETLRLLEGRLTRVD